MMEDFQGILTGIGACLCAGEHLMVLISTLDDGPLWVTKEGWIRDIKRIRLCKIPLEEATNVLFGKYLKLAASEKIRNTLRLCIADCNGHGRSMEGLATMLKQKIQWKIFPSYSEIMNPLIDRINCLFAPSEQQLRAALSGDPVHRDQLIEDKTLASWIGYGTYLNFDAYEGFLIPLLSGLRLRLHSRSYPAINDGQCNIPYCLEQMLNYDPDNLPFEQFLSWYEVLRNLLFPPEDRTDLKTLYKLNEAIGPMVKAPRFKGVTHLEEHFPSTGLIRDPYYEEDLFRTVFVLHSNNPGFGIAYIAKKADGSGHIAICINCQYSYINDGTKLTEEEVASTVAQLKKSWQPFVRDGKNVGEWYGKQDCTIGSLEMDLNDIYQSSLHSETTSNCNKWTPDAT